MTSLHTNLNDQQQEDGDNHQQSEEDVILRTVEKAGIHNVHAKQLQTPEGRTVVAERIDEERLSLLKPYIIEQMNRQQAREQLKQMGSSLRLRLAYMHSAAGHQMLMSALGMTVIPLIGSMVSHMQGKQERVDHKALLEDLRRFMLLAAKAGVSVDALEDKEITIREPGGKLITTLFCLPARFIRRMQTRHDTKVVDEAVADIIKELDTIALSTTAMAA